MPYDPMQPPPPTPSTLGAQVPGQQPMMPSGNDKAYAALMMSQDLSAQEKALAMQQAQATKLRDSGMQPSARRDFGSQATRALQGIGGAMAQNKYQQDFDQYKLDKVGQNQRIQDILGIGQKPLQTPPYTDGGMTPEGMP